MHKLPESSLASKELAQQQLEAFAANPGLVELAQLFGESDLPDDTRDKLARLQEIAAEHWNFQKGAERQATDWNDDLLDQPDSPQWNTVFHAADQLGLVRNTIPTNKHPNTVAILGGANMAPLDRLRYALGVVEDFDQVVYLGSSRAIPPGSPERAKIASYVEKANDDTVHLTEADLGSAAFEALLGATKIDDVTIERDGDTWGMRLYEFERNGQTKYGWVLSTPQTLGSRKARATTYDNYRFLARQLELDKDPNHTVVAVTTGLYTAEQHLPAVQELTLPYGAQVETVGHSAQYSGVTRKPAQLLQGTKAAIDAAVRLETALAAE
jgi:hypothetical protein